MKNLTPTTDKESESSLRNITLSHLFRQPPFAHAVVWHAIEKK
jgi:hypothetical protein